MIALQAPRCCLGLTLGLLFTITLACIALVVLLEDDSHIARIESIVHTTLPNDYYTPRGKPILLFDHLVQQIQNISEPLHEIDNGPLVEWNSHNMIYDFYSVGRLLLCSLQTTDTGYATINMYTQSLTPLATHLGIVKGLGIAATIPRSGWEIERGIEIGHFRAQHVRAFGSNGIVAVGSGTIHIYVNEKNYMYSCSERAHDIRVLSYSSESVSLVILEDDSLFRVLKSNDSSEHIQKHPVADSSDLFKCHSLHVVTIDSTNLLLVEKCESLTHFRVQVHRYSNVQDGTWKRTLPKIGDTPLLSSKFDMTVVLSSQSSSLIAIVTGQYLQLYYLNSSESETLSFADANDVVSSITVSADGDQIAVSVHKSSSISFLERRGSGWEYKK